MNKMMNKEQKIDWKKHIRDYFGIDDNTCIAERPDFLEKNDYQKRCIEDELMGRKLIEHFDIYEDLYDMRPTYVSNLDMQYAGVDAIVNYGSRSLLIDEKTCIGGTSYNDNITLELMQRDKFGRWHKTQEGKLTNELFYVNICLDTMKLYAVRYSYPQMKLRADKYLSFMPECIKDLPPFGNIECFWKTGSGEGIYNLVPFNEAITAAAEYDITPLTEEAGFVRKDNE